MTSPIRCLPAVEEESLSGPSRHELHRLTLSKLALGSAILVNIVSMKRATKQLPVMTKEYSLYTLYNEMTK